MWQLVNLFTHESLVNFHLVIFFPHTIRLIIPFFPFRRHAVVCHNNERLTFCLKAIINSLFHSSKCSERERANLIIRHVCVTQIRYLYYPLMSSESQQRAIIGWLSCTVVERDLLYFGTSSW